MVITPSTFQTSQPPVSRKPGELPPISLVDPITSKQLHLESPFSDKLLNLTPWQKVKLGLNNTFIELPKAVIQGLKGDSEHSFGDFLSITKIPYYLGGAILALSFRAGRDKVNFVRQAIGVGLYYLGVALANKAIDAVYKIRYGVDLGLRYRKPNGDIEKVFASTEFPRLDLLTPQHYAVMHRKMGIPDNIADPNAETNKEVKRIISVSRADKLILGNLLAALGAGYLARSNGWARLLGAQGTLRKIWTDPLQGGVLNKVANSFTAVGSFLGKGIQEKITGLPGEANPWLRKGVWGAAAALVFTVLAHAWFTRSAKPRYESPMLSPGFSRGEPYLPDTELIQTRSLVQSANSAFSAFHAARQGIYEQGGPSA